MTKRPEYREVPKWSRRFALSELDSGDTRRIVEALLSFAFNDEDWQFVQNLLIRYSNHQEQNIRYMAMLCFGHLCRIHRTIDKDRVLPILQAGLKDEEKYVRGAAEDALSDIEMFYGRPDEQ